MYRMIGKFNKNNGRLLVKYDDHGWAKPTKEDEFSNSILFSGEIYNLLSLQEDLKNKGAKEYNSDTAEVLLKYYRVFGINRMLSEINGIFAFVIFDKEKQVLYVVRDHMGIFPVYYYEYDKGILFSSEVKNFLKIGVPAKFSREGLFSYLVNQSVDEPFTLIRNIRALPPGSVMTISKNGGVKYELYWDAAYSCNGKNKQIDSFDEAGAKLRKLLFDSVKIRTEGSKKTGVLLSGGIDSSAIVCLMRSMRPNDQIDTFTVIHENPKYDEREYAHLVAQKNNTTEHDLSITSRLIGEYLDDALNNADQPSLDGINTYFSSRLIKKLGFDAVISGLGGEFFVEDDISVYLKLQKYSRVLQYAPNWTGRLLDRVVSNKKVKTFSECITSKDAYFVSQRLLSDGEALKLLNDDIAGQLKRIRNKWEDIAYDEIIKRGENLPDAIAKKYYYESKTWHVSTLLKDVMQNSINQGLKTKFPLMDYRLMEYLFSLPLASKADFRTSKVHLVNAAGNGLPKECIYRKKMGFVFPFADYFQTELKDEMVSFYLAGDAEALFNRNMLKRIWNDFVNGHESWTIIWKLFVLDRWIKKWNVEM